MCLGLDFILAKKDFQNVKTALGDAFANVLDSAKSEALAW